MRGDIPPDDQGRNDENFPEFLTYPQAAALLQVSERTLWTWVHERGVPHFRIGRTVRFSRSALLRWFFQQLRGGTDARDAEDGAGAGDGRGEDRGDGKADDDEAGREADRDNEAA